MPKGESRIASAALQTLLRTRCVMISIVLGAHCRHPPPPPRMP
jgi:hypothetical protein